MSSTLGEWKAPYFLYKRISSNKEIWNIDLKIDLNITDSAFLDKLAYLLFSSISSH